MMDTRVSTNNRPIANQGVAQRTNATQPPKFEGERGSTMSSNPRTNIENSNVGNVDQRQTVQELEKAIRAIQGPQKQLEISMHEKTNTIMIKVMDKDTGEVIREVPPEKILDLAAKMMEITGIIIDEKV